MILKAQILRSVRCQIEKQQLRRHYPKTSIEWSLEIPETCDLQLYCFSYFLWSQDLQLPVSFMYAVAKNVKPLVQNSLCENFYFISPSFIIRPASKDTTNSSWMFCFHNINNDFASGGMFMMDSKLPIIQNYHFSF